MQWELLINPVVGGLIGYGTNYLAIKMLFRPHDAKYIGGFKIPFTPGLIPKEKENLACQMGKVTEEYLLTEDTLVQALTDDKAEAVFGDIARKIFETIENSDKTIGEIIGNDRYLDRIIDKLSLKTAELLESEEVRSYISGQLQEVFINYISQGIYNNSIQSYIEELINKILTKEKTKLYLYKELDKLEEGICAIVEDNAYIIGKSIINAINQDKVSEGIKESLRNWINENFNQMISAFINVDKIYNGIIDYGNQALEDSNSINKFASLLSAAIKELIKNNPDYKERLITKAEKQINTEKINRLLQVSVDIFKDENISIQNTVEDIIRKLDFAKISKKAFREMQVVIYHMPVSKLGRLISDNKSQDISKKLFIYYSKVIRDNSSQVSRIMDISKIVEDKINQYSSQEAEEVILSVVRDQLRGITLIGALLGTIIGILTNLIS